MISNNNIDKLTNAIIMIEQELWGRQPKNMTEYPRIDILMKINEPISAYRRTVRNEVFPGV